MTCRIRFLLEVLLVWSDVGWHGRTIRYERRDGFSLSNLHHRDMRSIRALMHCMAGRLVGGNFVPCRCHAGHASVEHWMENESIDPAVRKSDVHAVSE